LTSKGLRETIVVLLDHRTVRRVGAGVVDQNVDAAERLEGQVDAAAGLVFVHGVRGDANGAAGDLGGRLVGGLLLA
jgi:hypothetical protein